MDLDTTSWEALMADPSNPSPPPHRGPRCAVATTGLPNARRWDLAVTAGLPHAVLERERNRREAADWGRRRSAHCGGGTGGDWAGEDKTDWGVISRSRFPPGGMRRKTSTRMELLMCLCLSVPHENGPGSHRLLTSNEW